VTFVQKTHGGNQTQAETLGSRGLQGLCQSPAVGRENHGSREKLCSGPG
jgi:hypothetical protein